MNDAFKGFASLYSAPAFQSAFPVYTVRNDTALYYSAVQSEKYTEALNQLTVYSNLGANWDGYGAVQISEQAIDCARVLISTQQYTGVSRLAVPDITPTPNGTIVLEWHGSNGEAAVEIGNTRVSGIIRAVNSPTLYVSGDTARLNEYLPAFIAPYLNPESPTAAAITPVEYEPAANV